MIRINACKLKDVRRYESYMNEQLLQIFNMKTCLQSTAIYHSTLSLSNSPHSESNRQYKSKVERRFKHGISGYCDRTNKQTRCWKICECNTLYRRKIIQTAIIGWAFFFLGWSVGIFGPCFPDLMLLLNKDLEAASWLFSIGAFGYLVGSMLGGVVYDRYNKLLLLFVSVIGMSVTNGAIPWCPSLPLMLVMTFLCSMFEGGIETGGNADIVTLWGAECSPFMLAIHFAYSAGGIISPFVTQPFLAKRLLRPASSENITHSPWNTSNNIDASFPLGNNSFDNGRVADIQRAVIGNANSATIQLFREQGTSLGISTPSVLLQYTGNTNISDSRRTTDYEVLENFENYGKTNIQYSFLIAAILSLSAAIPFLVLYFTSWTEQQKRKNTDKLNTNAVEIALRNRHSSIPFRHKLTCLVLLSTIMFLYNAVEDNFTGLLMTFSISYLGWSYCHIFGLGFFCIRAITWHFRCEMCTNKFHTNRTFGVINTFTHRFSFS